MIAIMRRKKKLIEKILVKGVKYTDPISIKEAIVDHFKMQYAKKDVSSFDISNLGLPALTEDQSQGLIGAVIVEEIKEALMSSAPSKAPGYDRFNIRCTKHIWPIIGEEFSNCILRFFDTG